MARRNLSRLMICALLMGACSGSNGDPDGGHDAGVDTTPPVELVDPVIGTGGRYFEFGSTFMGACLPHGMAKPGPNTTTEHGAAVFHHFSGYHAEDDRINGFGQVHISGTGAVDYGALLIMPTAAFDLGGGKTFEVIAEGASAENLYIQSTRLNGEDLVRPWFDHADLASGGKL
jgi:putative alpha-1,2-mannosidase